MHHSAGCITDDDRQAQLLKREAVVMFNVVVVYIAGDVLPAGAGHVKEALIYTGGSLYPSSGPLADCHPDGAPRRPGAKEFERIHRTEAVRHRQGRKLQTDCDGAGRRRPFSASS